MLEISKTKVTNKIARNLFFLYGAHAARFILPLVTLPYLTHVLGPSKWGIVAFIMAYTQYIAMLIEFGFGLSATREVSSKRESKRELSKILTGVLFAQSVLAFAGILITLAIFPLIPIFASNTITLWVGVFAALFQGLNLLWYYQGIEEMQISASLDIVAKFVAITAILLLVKTPNDGWKVFASYLVANFISFIIGFVLAIWRVSLAKLNIRTMLRRIKENWLFFVVRLNGIFFSAGNILILGLFSSPEVVGYFAAAERVANAVRSLLTPAVQGIYPKISRLSEINLSKAKKFIRKELWIFVAIASTLGIILYIFSYSIIQYYLGMDYMESLSPLRILSFLPIPVAINLVLGSHWLLSLRKDWLFTAIGIVVSLINMIITISVVLVKPTWAHIGTSLAVVISQGIAALLLLFFITRKDSQLSLSNRDILLK